MREQSIIISPTGILFIFNTIDDSAGNNNQLVDYDELIIMDVSIQNVKFEIDATSVNVVIQLLIQNINLILILIL